MTGVYVLVDVFGESERLVIRVDGDGWLGLLLSTHYTQTQWLFTICYFHNLLDDLIQSRQQLFAVIDLITEQWLRHVAEWCLLRHFRNGGSNQEPFRWESNTLTTDKTILPHICLIQICWVNLNWTGQFFRTNKWCTTHWAYCVFLPCCCRWLLITSLATPIHNIYLLFWWWGRLDLTRNKNC